MEWLALLIPITIISLAYFFFKKQFVWWELTIPTLACAVCILVCKAISTVDLVDEEYHGDLIVEANYYEYYETWVTKTCSYTTTSCSGSGNSRVCHSTTHYYDCSYCDHNSAYWVAVSKTGKEFTISKTYYEYLQRKWNSTPEFVELNRNIHNRGSCGKDGDMYKIRWDNQIETSEACVTVHNYTNKVQAAHTAFKLPKITKKQAQQYQLYEYPKFYDYYKQKVILGLDSIYPIANVNYIETRLQYFNGDRGVKNKIKVFVLLYYDKPLSIAFKQQAYWSGGNQNELLICIGINKTTKEIQWVQPFSWTENKRLLVNCREDIAETKYFNPLLIYDILDKNVSGSVYRNFKKDFSYLTIEMPNWGLWLTYILTFICSIGVTFGLIMNDQQNYKETNKFETIDWKGYADKIKRFFTFKR